MDIYNKLLESKIKKENIYVNEDMSKHTSFKTGGKADYFIKVYSIEEIKNILKISKENNIPFLVLGNGTNVLVKDEGYKGIIIQIKMEEIHIDGTHVTVDSGTKNATLSRKLLENSLTGFEFASGIPGTIGGAIKMNAGAYGSEMKDIVLEVTYLDYDGNIYKISNDDCKFQYRSSIFSQKNAIILQAKLNFRLRKKRRNRKKSKRIINTTKRKTTT